MTTEQQIQTTFDLYTVRAQPSDAPFRLGIATADEAIDRAAAILTEMGGAMDVAQGDHWIARVFDDGGIDFKSGKRPGR